MSERFSLDTLYRGHALVLSTVFVIGVFAGVFCKVAWSRGQQLKNLLRHFFANSRASLGRQRMCKVQET